jgi:hypothetical protein
MSIEAVFANVGPQITGALRKAAQATGISFEYLLTTAQIESNLNPAAKAPTSTAKGLFQFIDQTWLGTVKQYGAALGFGHYADAISRTPDGHYEVTDSKTRSAILQLRSDPAASAALAGAFTRNNADQLAAAIGRRPSEGELYIAHFLGSDGAGKLINAATSQPDVNAVSKFPAAAAANRSIFYDRSGAPRSASAVYANLTGRFEIARAIQFGPGARVNTAVASTAPVTLRGVPDTAGITQVYAAAHSAPVVESKPLFESIFSDRGQAPIAPAVTSLWARNNQANGNTSPSNEPGRGLNLFTDGRADARKLFGNS